MEKTTDGGEPHLIGPRDRGTGVIGSGVLIALLGISLLTLVAAGPTGGTRVSPGDSPGALPLSPSSTSGPCATPLAPTTISGSLAVEGGPDPPSPGGVLVTYGAYIQEKISTGGSVTYSCFAEDGGSSFTASSGSNRSSYAVTFTLPQSSCQGGTCVTYTGPYEPVSLQVNETPPGYFLTQSQDDFTWVWALSRATFDPSGSDGLLVVSTGASFNVTAQAWAANGEESPASSLTYSWALSGGTGFSFRGAAAPAGAQAPLEAGVEPSQETLTLSISGIYGGIRETIPLVSLDLVSYATTGGVLSANRSTLDSGQTVTLSLEGTTGAAGYSYWARFFPNGTLGSSQVMACSAVPAGPGEVSLDCQDTVTYWTNGSAAESLVPAVIVSNGASQTPLIPMAGTLTINSAMEVSLTPSAPGTYVNGTLIWTLVVSGGTPGYRYCLRPITLGPWSCTPVAEETQTQQSFAVPYNSPGPVTATGAVRDASGANVTRQASVGIWYPPVLSPIGGGPWQPDPGEAVRLNATVTHGAFPLDVWWNSSQGGSLCTLLGLSRDGELTCNFTPGWSGAATVALTLRDGLGTQLTRTVTITVVSPLSIGSLEARAGNNTAGAGDLLEDEVGALTQLQATLEGGSAPFTVIWTYNRTLIAQVSTTLTAVNATFTWTHVGEYRLTVEAVDSFGETANSSLWVRVNPRLSGVNIAISHDPTDVNISNNLSARYQGGVGPYTFAWDAGDGFRVTTNAPWTSYAWTQAGTFGLSVTVTDGAGVSVSTNLSVEVNPLPRASCAPSASEDPAEAGIPLSLRIECVTGGTPSFTYSWVFGDGTTTESHLPSVSHTYVSAGTYSVSVTITDAVGGVAVSQDLSVTVNARLAVQIPTGGEAGCPLGTDWDPVDAGIEDPLCAALSGGVGPVSLQWFENSSVLTTAQVRFSNPGNYTITVTATDSLGSQATARRTFSVIPPPRVHVMSERSSLDVGQVLRLSTSVSGGAGEPQNWTYTWLLDDRFLASGRTLNYTFSNTSNPGSPGSYNFTVVATDLEGATNSSSVLVLLHPDPTGAVVIDPGNVDLDHPLSAFAHVLGGTPPYTLNWSVAPGGGGPTTDLGVFGLNVSLPTSVPGPYVVMASVTDAAGWQVNLTPALYTVNSPLGITLSLRGSSGVSGAALVGTPVQVSVCVKGGGTPPYEALLNFTGADNGTATLSIPASGICAVTNTTFPRAGPVGASATVVDSQGLRSAPARQSLWVLEPARLPRLSPSSLVAEFETPFRIVALVNGSFTEVRWDIPPSDDLSPQVGPNGTLWVQPGLIGNFSLGVTAQVVFEGQDLGPPAEENFSLLVVPGPVETVTARVSNSSYTAVAGQNFTLIWQAFDRWGNPVGSFQENVTLDISGPAPLVAEANLSLPGIASAGGADGHQFDIPSSAWKEGTLVLNLSDTRTGNLTLNFSATWEPQVWPGPRDGPALSLQWVPDLSHLRLSDPHVAVDTAQENDTLWRIGDVYGNPLTAGYVVIRATWGSYSQVYQSPIRVNDTGSFVWVNYTVVGTSGGNVTVSSAGGELLLPPLEIPPPRAPASGEPLGFWPMTGGALLVLGGLASLVGFALFLRSRGSLRARENRVETGEEDLQRDEEIRAALLGALRPGMPRTLPELTADLRGSGISRAEMVSHLHRLMVEGEVGWQDGPEGEFPRLVRLPRGDGSGGTPALVLDETALERALRARPEPDPREGGPSGTER